MSYDLRPITIKAGVASTTDFTPQSTQHWTYTDKVRFVDEYPEKIGGWLTLPLSGIYSILGTVRTIFSYTLGNVIYYTIGTNSNVYSITNNTLFNATSMDAATDTYNNILGTLYGLLTNDPLFTVAGTNTVTVTDVAHPFFTGDSVLLSGAAGFGGIPAGDFNTSQLVTYIDADHYSFNTPTVATVTLPGGGAVVNRTSRLVTVQQANDYQMGQNVTISALGAPVGGIPVADIEGIRVVRNVTATSYNILADAFASSSATAAGGAITIAHEIPAGPVNSTVGSGYGMGLYGVGLYGTALSSTTPTLPRIWSMDRFGLLAIMTPGTQTGLYQWDSTTATLPALVVNAPTAVNYAFSSDNIAVVLGADGTPQRVQWSDLGGLTIWTATAQNQAGLQDLEGAAQLISHAAMPGFNLLFTGTQVYTMRYIGPPFVWQFALLDTGHGLIAQNARIVVNGVAFWMGNGNWYMYSGGNVTVIPSNSTTESTIRKYIFNNLNSANISKIFCWYNPSFDEIWWHVPTGSSTEPNTVARFNIREQTWCMDTADRTAGEYPNVQNQGNVPYLAGSNSTIYQHEIGYDDDGEALAFSCYGPYFSTTSTRIVNLGGLFPDNIVTGGLISVGINTKRYPSQIAGSVAYDINSLGGFDSGFDSGFQTGNGTLNLTYRKNCRYWQYGIFGNVQGQFWRAGQWQELYMLTRGTR